MKPKKGEGGWCHPPPPTLKCLSYVVHPCAYFSALCLYADIGKKEGGGGVKSPILANP